mmetsp:Transcript_142102/g.258273  ORF Transcript_142102/g.258273 Transcript_142102/m.258273 type:complete len:536 (-) Transcript_142102:82-1689(-)
MGNAACTKMGVGSTEKVDGRHSERRNSEQVRRMSVQAKAGGFAGGDFMIENRGAFSEFYKINWNTVMGEGTCATVYQCTKLATEQKHAVKVIRTNKGNKKVHGKQEINIMKALDHPNIVRMQEVFQDDDSMYLVLELCNGGELFDSIVDRGAFPERATAIILNQILRGVSYIHSNDVVHRDMKAENWLLATEVRPERTTLKLCDFGLSKHLLPGQMALTKAGTPYYVAPEVLDAHKTGGYGTKADVWGIGVIFFMLLGGAPPFTGDNTQEVLEAVKVKPVKVTALGRSISDEAKELLYALLERDVEKRLSAQDAMSHTFITRILRTESSAKKGNALRSSIKAGNYGHRAKNVATALKRFAVANQVEKASIHVLATQMSREDLLDLEQAFMEMDLNGDGTLNAAEFAEGMRRAGIPMTYEEAVDVFEKIDTDGSGAMDYSEFVAAMMDSSRAGSENDWYKAFKVFDLDGSGTIERSELRQLLSSKEADKMFGNRDIDKIYKELDNDGDGRIDFQEFMTMMNGMDRLTKTRTAQSLG